MDQSNLAVDEWFRALSRDGDDFHWHREPWVDGQSPAASPGATHVVMPVFSADPERARAMAAWLRDCPPRLPMLAVLPGAWGEGELAAAARLVDDFVRWPCDCGEVRQRLARLVGGTRDAVEDLRVRLNLELGLGQLVGSSSAFTACLRKIPRIAAADGGVLITGETGTGKELCARAIHQLGPRRGGPFVPVDCGAYPEALLENELFGHARGAFTDARGDQAGLAALAEGGTLFLDEIDALTLPAQAKLLRFLESRTYKPLGSDRFLTADVRVLAATNANLETLVHEKRFRSDLYFRLNVFALRMPPLRERPEDIPALVAHLLERLAAERGRIALRISEGALHRLVARAWPGNVRELANELRRAVAFAEGPTILAAHLEPRGDEAAETPATFREARKRALLEFERGYLSELLGRHRGNITRAAREAGQDRRALGRLAKKHRLTHPVG